MGCTTLCTVYQLTHATTTPLRAWSLHDAPIQMHVIRTRSCVSSAWGTSPEERGSSPGPCPALCSPSHSPSWLHAKAANSTAQRECGESAAANTYACFVGTYVIMYAYKHTMHTCRYEQDVTIRTCVHRQDGDLYTVPSVGN